MRPTLRLAGSLLVAAALAACGSDDSVGTGSVGGTETTVETVSDAKPRVKPLPRALYPRCIPRGFGQPAVGRAGLAWRLIYRWPGNAPYAPPAGTSFIQLQELPLETEPVEYTNPRTLRAGGRTVELVRQPDTQVPLFHGQWAGKRARYVALVDGDAKRTFRRLAACT
jgi:hypothetical protein